VMTVGRFRRAVITVLAAMGSLVEGRPQSAPALAQ
jgi:hypothetical protein